MRGRDKPLLVRWECRLAFYAHPVGISRSRTSPFSLTHIHTLQTYLHTYIQTHTHTPETVGMHTHTDAREDTKYTHEKTGKNHSLPIQPCPGWHITEATPYG